MCQFHGKRLLQRALNEFACVMCYFESSPLSELKDNTLALVLLRITSREGKLACCCAMRSNNAIHQKSSNERKRLTSLLQCTSLLRFTWANNVAS